MKAMNLKDIMEAFKKLADCSDRAHRVEKLYGEDHKYYIEAANDVEAAESRYESIADPIRTAIKSAEGRATARTITAEKMLYALIQVEKKLDITKKAMDGIKVTIDINSQSFPNAYKYTPESTHFSAEYKNGSWRLTDIYRAECKNSFHIRIEHTEESKKAIIDRLSNF